MKWIVNLKSWSLGLAAILLIGVAGCSNSETASEPGESSGAATAEVDHSHSGYWCVEHGVPEAECARCDKSLVAKFKEDGDWCEEHDRPESQCFICSPNERTSSLPSTKPRLVTNRPYQRSKECPKSVRSASVAYSKIVSRT